MFYNYTIIIPHFTKDGNLSLLYRALESIPRRDDIQIIVVDNSVIPIQLNANNLNKNVTLLYSDNKRGAGGARNLGIQNALGVWLLFLDADDYFVKDAFVVMDRYLYSKNDIVFFKPTSQINNLGTLSDRHLAYSNMIDDYFVSGCSTNLRLNHCIPWSKMIKNELVRENDIYFDEVPASNDVIFSLMIGLHASKVIADSNVIYCVTVSDGSITKTETLRNLESRFKVAIKKNDILRSRGYKADVSIIFYVVKSMKYGFDIFIKFFFKAIASGYILVGWKRWGQTFRMLK